MRRPANFVKLNESGTTLIELMIALIILLITALAMMSTTLMSMQTNTRNALRDQAVNVAEVRMNEFRSSIFDDLAPTIGEVPDGVVEQKLRAATIRFDLKRSIANIGDDTKQVSVTVNWKFKNESYTHRITTIVRRS